MRNAARRLGTRQHAGRAGELSAAAEPHATQDSHARITKSETEPLTVTIYSAEGSGPSRDAALSTAGGAEHLRRRYRQLMSRLSRITSDPSVCHGQPTVRGMRYPVGNLLELLSSGMTIDDVLQDYPDLERDDLLAALEFGALTAGGGRVVPLGAA